MRSLIDLYQDETLFEELSSGRESALPTQIDGESAEDSTQGAPRAMVPLLRSRRGHHVILICVEDNAWQFSYRFGKISGQSSNRRFPS